MVRKSLKESNAREKFKHELCEWIRREGLRSGDKILSQNKLAELVDASVPTVYKGLKELEKEGIIYRIKGKGTYVGSTDKRIKHVISTLDSFTQATLIHDPFMFRLYSSMNDEAIRCGMLHSHMPVRPGEGRTELDFDKLWNIATRPGVDGLIVVLSRIEDEKQMIRFSQQSSVPLVWLWNKLEHPAINYIDSDHRDATERLLKQAGQCGLKSFIAIGSDTRTFSNHERMKAFMDLTKGAPCYSLRMTSKKEDLTILIDQIEAEGLPECLFLPGCGIMKYLNEMVADHPWLRSIPILTFDYSPNAYKWGRNLQVLASAQQSVESIGFSAIEFFTREPKTPLKKIFPSKIVTFNNSGSDKSIKGLNKKTVDSQHSEDVLEM